MAREAIIVDINDVEAVEESIGRSGKIVAKTLPLRTFLPEVEMDLTWVGVHYGPQLQDDECVVLFLQFPGPSGGRSSLAAE